MSGTCIYQEFAIRIKAASIGFEEDQFLLVGLTGSSNSYIGKKRSRRWSVYAAGSHANIMANAINAASSCDSGSLSLGSFGESGYALGETYISRVRRKLKNAFECEPHRLRGVIQGLAVCVYPKNLDHYSSEEDLLAGLSAALSIIYGDFNADHKTDLSSLFSVHGVTDC